MADNFLERHREQYEARKAAWLRKSTVKHDRQQTPQNIDRSQIPWH